MSDEPLADGELGAILARHGVTRGEPWCGAACPPGWLPLVDALLGDLVAMGWRGNLLQLKSKVGEVRVYVDGTWPDVLHRILAATAESARTCEGCGAPAHRRVDVDGWIATECDGCWRDDGDGRR